MIDLTVIGRHINDCIISLYWKVQFVTILTRLVEAKIQCTSIDSIRACKSNFAPISAYLLSYKVTHKSQKDILDTLKDLPNVGI